MPHSPELEARAAQRELEAAREACPHWDYESDSELDECCYRVTEARLRLRRVRHSSR